MTTYERRYKVEKVGPKARHWWVRDLTDGEVATRGRWGCEARPAAPRFFDSAVGAKMAAGRLADLERSGS